MTGSVIRTAIIDADYDEYRPETMRGFVVQIYDGEGVVETRTFLLVEKASEFAFANADRVYHLSSVDHYFYDLRRPKCVK